MSLSTKKIIDRLDEATRVNRDAKQVCNDALSLARGRIQNLQIDMEWKDARIKDMEGIIKAKVEEIKKLQAEVADLKGREMVEGNCEILQDTSGNITFKCSSGSGEDRWIPCSEKLPDNYADVLIQIEYRDRCRNDIRVGYHSMEHKKWFLGGFANSHESIPDGLVIAWQPLPEEYVVPEVEELVEEEVKLEVGDFVQCVSKDGLKRNAVYLGVDEEHYWILDKQCLTQQPLDKNHWKLTKYPGHISVVDWLNGLPES